MKLSLYTSFAFSCLLLFSCGPEKKQSPVVQSHPASTDEVTLTEDQLKSAAIETGKPFSRVISGTLKVNGTLDVPPQNLVSISAPLGGFVKHTNLLQGMKVTKGQVLVVLEGPEYIQLQEDFLNSKSQLEYLSQEYDRQRELSTENVSAAKTMQLSKSNFLGMKARKEGLEAKLKMINVDPNKLENGPIQSAVTILSPITGFISQININLGMHVNPTDVMLQVVDTEHLHAEAQVFDKDIGLLKIGQKVRLHLANDQLERRATVYLIGKEVSADRTVRVHCHFDDEDPTLIPGLFFDASIEISNRSVPALPDDAVVTYDGKKYVFAAADRLHFILKEIKTGAVESGYTEVLLSDSLASSNLVIHGAYQLLSQLKISENDD